MEPNWKTEYIEKLGTANVEELQIESAQFLKLNNLPRFLYKYRAVNDYSLENLESDTVYLNSPSEYNDPFEFVESVNYNKIYGAINGLMKEEIIAGLTESFPVPESILEKARNSEDAMTVIGGYQLQAFEGMTQQQTDEIANILKDISEKMYIERHVQKLQHLQENMKVCSFCESHEQLLMWSHYADCHKGFCIEYEIGKWPRNDVRNRILAPVVYQDFLYDVTEHMLSQMRENAFNNLYPIISGATKSKEWEYEKEWRFIFPIGPSFERQNYPMGCQSRVFLGARMSNGDKEKIMGICRKKGIGVFQAKPSNAMYRLEFVEIPE